MPVMAVHRFERFFRAAAGLDVDKNDLKRYNDFIEHNLRDLFLIGRAHAKTNGRDIIESHDLPITTGLQESIHRFRKLDEYIELQPLLDQLATWPADITPSEETRAKLPEITGGLSLALAEAFRIIDPDQKNPSTEHWTKAFRLFDLLL
jgi:hypothetical protein